MELFPNRTIEFTLAIPLSGCVVKCLKYCPQEVIMKRYTSKVRSFSMDTFRTVLSHTPNNIGVIIAGATEPYINRLCTDMMKEVLRQGRHLKFYSTLWGATDNDIDELVRLDREYKGKVIVQIHLPDGVVMKEPPTLNYPEHFFKLQTNLSNILLMSMKGAFKSNDRENTARGRNLHYRRYGHCDRANLCLSPFILPNGDTYLCCYDFGLRHKVGNILTDRYETLANYCLEREGKFELCRCCSENKPYLRRHFWRSIQRFREVINPRDQNFL